ncbi:hypothetical protein RZS08_62515, partial [Arthrospira platensis SPKY1]|nr:hypothetical protein [Arthrospira platensis SPKY1]
EEGEGGDQRAGADAGDPSECGPGSSLRPTHQQAGAERAIVAPAGNGQKSHRRQRTLAPGAGQIVPLALGRGNGVPNERFDVGIDPVAGVGNAGDFRSGGILDRHGG